MLKGVRPYCPCNLGKSTLRISFVFYNLISLFHFYFESEALWKKRFFIGIEYTNESDGFGRNQHREAQEIQSQC